MKRLLIFALCALMICSFVGCDGEDGGETETAATTAATAAETEAEAKGASVKDYSSPDIDLTKLTSTMVYSQVNSFMQTPSVFLGQVVKMQGPFSVYTDETTGKNYFAVIIKDATACCAQGIEFVLEGNPEYPAGYPELGTEITVTGVFGVYYEGENMYCQLSNAVLDA